MKCMKRVFCLLMAGVLSGCHGSPSSAEKQESKIENAPVEVPENSGVAAGNASLAAERESGPAHVDCPLRKAGLDPTKVKPFDENEQYIQFLDRADREEWQKNRDVIDAMALNGSERIFDLGAGSGYFSFPLAARMTQGGRVFAGDTEPEMVMHVHHKAMLEGVGNLEARIIDARKPEIPDQIDVIFMCDVLHHVENRVDWLSHISGQMMPGSRFYMIEFREGEIPAGPPENAKIPKTQLIEDAQRAGLALSREITGILPYQYYLEFVRE